MTTFLGLLAVLALIAANAWFVAAEFGYVAVRRGRLEEAAEAGDASAGRAMGVLSRLGFMLSGAQFGITVTSLVVGFIAEPVFERLFSPLFRVAGLDGTARTAAATALGFLVAVAAQMVLGELAPKNYAIARPELVARRQARGLALYMRLFGPIVRLFDGSANALLARFGLHAVEEIDATVTVEELDYIVDAAAEAGSLSDGQVALLRRALEFRNLTAEKIMVPRRKVDTLPLDATGADLLAAARRAHTRFPVVERTGAGIDEVRGVVSVKQLVAVKPALRATARVSELMNTKPVEAVEAASAQDLLSSFRRRGQELAVIIDEYGDLAGIVTLEDLVERLVGPIEDEYDPPEAGGELGTATPQGRRLRGSTLVADVARELGLDLPEGPYDTVGGLIMTRLGTVPTVGDRVEIATTGSDVALSFEVEEMDHRAVEWARLVSRTSTARGGGGS